MKAYDVLFQNEHFIAVDKAPGVLSVPARTPDDSRLVLGRELERELGRAIFPVHRLDAEVSGLVLYALSAEAHREANSAFENRRVKKTYQGVSQGGSFREGDEGTWKAKILRGKKRAYESPAGKMAVTDFQLIRLLGPQRFEWRLRPQTGRSHQLRWEMFRHESPLVGDTLYGSDQAWDRGGLALRSIELVFEPDFTQAWGLPEKLSAPLWSFDR